LPKGVSAATQRRIYHLNGMIDDLLVAGVRGLCDAQPEAFIDYDDPRDPLTYQAQATCAACPLLLLCRERARIEKPVWGVHGGEVWSDEGSPDDKGRILRRQRVKQLSAYVALAV
jgi:hypothetical protein